MGEKESIGLKNQRENFIFRKGLHLDIILIVSKQKLCYVEI